MEGANSIYSKSLISLSEQVAHVLCACTGHLSLLPGLQRRLECRLAPFASFPLARAVSSRQWRPHPRWDAPQELVDCDRASDQGCQGGMMNNAYEWIVEVRGCAVMRGARHGRTSCQQRGLLQL